MTSVARRMHPDADAVVVGRTLEDREERWIVERHAVYVGEYLNAPRPLSDGTVHLSECRLDIVEGQRSDPGGEFIGPGIADAFEFVIGKAGDNWRPIRSCNRFEWRVRD